MYIIILRGFSQSGKDFIGQILCNKYNYKRFAFADSLKKIVSNNFNCQLDILHSQKGKLQICNTDSLKRSYRQILIDESLRLKNDNINIFVEDCCNEIIKHNSEKILERIVITDWRYPNEIELLEKTFPQYKIFPIHVINIKQIKSPVEDISEYQLDARYFDYKLINQQNDTIYEEVDKLHNIIINT